MSCNTLTIIFDSLIKVEHEKVILFKCFYFSNIVLLLFKTFTKTLFSSNNGYDSNKVVFVELHSDSLGPFYYLFNWHLTLTILCQQTYFLTWQSKAV